MKLAISTKDDDHRLVLAVKSPPSRDQSSSIGSSSNKVMHALWGWSEYRKAGSSLSISAVKNRGSEVYKKKRIGHPASHVALHVCVNFRK